VFPTLVGGLDGGRTGPRATAFSERLENGMVTRLAANPQPILIPLARLLVAKEG
jgi:salicylate 1-O-methyltransferase